MNFISWTYIIDSKIKNWEVAPIKFAPPNDNTSDEERTVGVGKKTEDR